jgi:TetR/AcrR family transcriptional repressor of bet genes
MPKVGQEPIRRQQMIEATMACIRDEGVNRATMQRIAKRAGLTSGLIVHYFTDKAGLFEAVYRELYRALTEVTRSRLAGAKTPVERLHAILDAQLSDEMLQPDVMATWCALYSLVPETPALARLERAYERRIESNLLAALREMGLPKGEASNITDELTSLIDGLWLNTSNRISMTPSKARAILRRYVSIRIPRIH